MFKHIVLFKIYNEVSEDKFVEALENLKKVGENNPLIVEWKVVQSLDVRKGRIIIQDSTFKDEETFNEFRISEEHKKATEIMREFADWTIGDYIQ